VAIEKVINIEISVALTNPSYSNIVDPIIGEKHVERT